MVVLVLIGVLALVVGGCACVVWAERGGPRWVRVVATMTLTASHLLRHAQKNRRRSRITGNGNGGDGGGD
ncbi:hypothetical protein [Streptomyces sp. BE133]|uniref:hypothetical protein n=1 Tax=Streptomyces sp. BE133 TaxID=3002523 RepID=UPI002E794592|nr:hypothetical protein [Streptomyces sp. BE133]MEE1812819.1 hypothetical protein [Streptomyces sp. BE133]